MNWISGLLERIIPSAVRRTDPLPAAPRRLLVDMSTIAQHDAGTGIQRVVRAIWLHPVSYTHLTLPTICSV